MRFLLLLIIVPFTLAAHCSRVLQQGIADFKAAHPLLAELSPEQVASLADSWQGKLMVRAEVDQPLRLVDPQTIRRLLEQEGPIHFVMRHGEQKVSDWVKKLPTLPEQKVAMMRVEENQSNPLTEASAVELMSTLVVLRYLQERTGVPFAVESSANCRSSQVGEALGQMLDTRALHVEAWDCVNYPEETSMPTDDLLRELSGGKLPWRRDVVNQVVGPKTYEQISQSVAQRLMGSRPGTHVVSVTHTQQTNAVCEQARLPVKRLEYYGFALLAEEVELFEQGIYQ